MADTTDRSYPGMLMKVKLSEPYGLNVMQWRPWNMTFDEWAAAEGVPAAELVEEWAYEWPTAFDQLGVERKLDVGDTVLALDSRGEYVVDEIDWIRMRHDRELPLLIGLSDGEWIRPEQVVALSSEDAPITDYCDLDAIAEVMRLK